MKPFLLSLIAISLSSTAFAIPGEYSLKCRSLEGAEQKVSIHIGKFEIDTDDFPAIAEANIDSMKFKATEDDSVASKIKVVRGLDDGVFTLRFDQQIKTKFAEITLWAKPKTVKLVDGDPDYNSKYKFVSEFRMRLGENDNSKYAEGRLECDLSQDAGS